MNARQEAEARLNGKGSGTDWAKADSMRGIGWALLALADAITAAAEKVNAR